MILWTLHQYILSFYVIFLYSIGLICAKAFFNYGVQNDRVIGGHDAPPNTWKWQVKPELFELLLQYSGFCIIKMRLSEFGDFIQLCKRCISVINIYHFWCTFVQDEKIVALLPSVFLSKLFKRFKTECLWIF